MERKYKSSIYPLLKIRINAKLLNEHINKYSKNIFQFFYYKRVKDQKMQSKRRMGQERNMGIESGRKREIENTYTPGREYLFFKV